MRLIVLLLLSSLMSAPCAEVITQHNDNARTGTNAAETILTPTTVSTATFGKLFTLKLTSSVNGQVLYVPGLPIGGQMHNVVFAYTSTNSNSSPCAVAAFDADSEGPALWLLKLPMGAQATTDTPAIDSATKTMYLVSKDKNDNGSTWLHAIDILTGTQRPGSPIKIEGSVPGNGAASVDGKVSFPATHANCRPGVLIEKGLIYIAFGFATDIHPYHGWLFCYGYDGTAFTQKAAFCSTPDADVGKPVNFSKDGGGIWQSGKGLASDGEAIYCTTGNGNLSAPEGGRNYSMCFLKLHPGDLAVVDWFAEYKAHQDSDADNDLGNCGPLIIPGTSVLFAGATKYGRSHLVDCANMGHFNEEHDTCLQTITTPVPPFPNGQNGVSWNSGATGTFIYVWNATQPVTQYTYDPQKRIITDAAPSHVSVATVGGGGGLTVTANGEHGGILWCIGVDGVVHALDALDISKELWTSAQNTGRDALGSVGKWQFPTVVAGKAYIPTGKGELVVYGLLPQ